ncbi:TetR/AcrR family transcriptional regulator, partial [Serratia silvae]
MVKDREITEQKLIDSIGHLIEKVGFENIGVNIVSKEAGVSKALIYRYFNSLDELIYRYMEKNDFWINLPQKLPEKSNIKIYLKQMFREQITQ